MKMHFRCCLAAWCLVLLPHHKASGQLAIVDVIKAAVVKTIKAVDLKIQRLQNKTIWLQNAQQVLENKMQQAHLGDIAGWVEKQRQLYAGYYNELRTVKQVIATYHQVKEVIAMQTALLKGYREALAALKKDPHFSAGEIKYLSNVYTGILEEDGKALDALLMTISSFTTQMSDGERLQNIQRFTSSMEKSFSDFQKLHQQTIRISLQRAKEASDIYQTKILYGLP